MKVGIIGLGMVGKEVLHYIIHFGSATEIVVVDLNKNRAQAEIWDFEDTYALRYYNTYSKITLGDMSDLKDCDIIIVNASVPMLTALRSDMAIGNDPLMKNIAKDCDQYAKDAFILLTTNPNDNMTRSFIRYSSRDPKKIIGSGTLLDSIRFQLHIAEHFGIAASSVQGFVLGEHGPAVFIPWSLCHIAGMSMDEFAKINNIAPIDKDKALEHVVSRAVHIFKERKCTDHGVGSATVRIAHSLLHNENLVLPVAVLIDNYLGLNDVVMSVPCVVGKKGANPLKITLNDAEMVELKKSYDAIMDVENKIIDSKK